MPKKIKPVFRIQFRHQDQLIELYAHGVSQSAMLGFVELSELIFDNKTDLLIDPSAEKLKSEFSGVKSTYIPIHSVLRIDEVDKLGINKIRPLAQGEQPIGNVSAFPFSSAPKDR